MSVANIVERAEREFAEFWKDRWYYSIELTPGNYTAGFEFNNVALTRSLLARCAIRGQRCLDIGTADGLVSTLMSRRGAAQVVAVDRNDFSQNIDQLRTKLSANIDYIPNLKQTDLVDRLRAAGHGTFDVVVSSGLLYHVYGPLNSLAYTRSLVRTGGILVVETAVAVTDAPVMYLNQNGRPYDEPTTF
jgi:tRNA (mo5U34)-methyltransferase